MTLNECLIERYVFVKYFNGFFTWENVKCLSIFTLNLTQNQKL